MKQSRHGFKNEECWQCVHFKKGKFFTGNKCTQYGEGKKVSRKGWCAFWQKRKPVEDVVPEWMLTLH